MLGTCGRGASCPQSHGAAAQERVEASRRHLLGRLLRDEVARETDALLQCLRYVVRSNFFDDEAAADAAAAAADGGSAASEKEPHAPAEPASE